ncbi:MAG: hypothetical protein JKY52_19715 [Flavobacteriales bacterium]|nr:hypothetical protein [Flavobacteriales bacterium]
MKAMSDSLDSLPQVFSSEKLTVHQASIVAHKSYMGLLSKSDLDSLLQDIAHLDQASLEITERNDTIIVRYQYVDTIFKMSENQILKKYKGHYYLNKKRDGEWEVLQISIRNGLLKLKSIEDSDAKLIGEISRYYRYRTNNIDPTKKTFTTFVKQGGFHGQKNYLKEKK